MLSKFWGCVTAPGLPAASWGGRVHPARNALIQSSGGHSRTVSQWMRDLHLFRCGGG
ncbi:hypothetical protein HMPREF0742_01364 [Rothia aeria F0184]|uniref:Uncharacterized protein n=1 Tax=Rothia aeria F0184 TaxID=888019 RepID=U7V355_9MICC|nr:hypothetical protein HMPREF0742_01364 [Rothia aeria F0184]